MLKKRLPLAHDVLRPGFTSQLQIAGNLPPVACQQKLINNIPNGGQVGNFLATDNNFMTPSTSSHKSLTEFLPQSYKASKVSYCGFI